MTGRALRSVCPNARLLLLLSLLLAAAAATALADDDPDTEVARRLFKQGGALYVAGDYARALDAFEKARTARPSAAFDFNIARCHDRLGRWNEALAEYERFLGAATDGADIAEANGRVVVLRERVKMAGSRAAADEHYKKAIGFHNGGEFGRAVEEFKLANQSAPDPLYLYNIAQAYRQAQDAGNAVTWYESFLKAAPASPLRKNVESRITELKTTAKAPSKALPALKSAPAGVPGAPVASERLKPVQELIKTNRAGFRACFDAWSGKHPGVAGKVNLSFYLDPDGVLNQPVAELKGFEAPEVAECIVAYSRTLLYPAAPNGRYTRFNYPFDFKPN